MFHEYILYIIYIYIWCVLTKTIVARHVATALYIRVTYRKWHMKSGEKWWNVTWVISYGISYILCIQSYLQHHVMRACTKYEAKFVHPLKTGHILWWWARTNRLCTGQCVYDEPAIPLCNHQMCIVACRVEIAHGTTSLVLCTDHGLDSWHCGGAAQCTILCTL